LSLGAAFAVVAIALSPFADQVASYLPFIGNVDTDNVTYRTRLFEVSMQVIAMNPLFGSSNFMLDPLMEQMRQGQGIIDIVNSYLGIALGTGYVGLAVYVSIYLVAMAKTWMGIRRSALISPELEGIGRALLGTTVGIMIIIATASCFLSMPFIIWIIMGLSLRYSQLTTNLGAVRYGQSASAHQPERPRQRTPGAA
jgi:O-antigen ligase